MKGKNKLAFAGITVLLVAMGMSNPDSSEHQMKMSSIITKIAEAGEEGGLFAQYAGTGMTGDAVTDRQVQIVTDAIENVSGTFIEKAVQTTISVTDYLFCSVGELDLADLGIEGIENDGEITTIGMFGHIFTISKAKNNE